MTAVGPGRFRAQVMLNGQRYSATLPTPLAAEDWLADLRRRHREGRLPPKSARGAPSPSLTVGTVGDVLAQYLVAKRAEGITVKQWRQHEANVGLHLRPALGHLLVTGPAVRQYPTSPGQRRAEVLTVAHIRALLAELGQRRAAQTVRHVLFTLRQALDLAVADGHLNRNVARDVKPPRRPRQVPRALLPDELARFWRVAQTHRLAALWLLAFRAGLRLGELRALRWTDLDVVRGTLTVQRTLPEGRRPGEEQPAKTFSGQRTFSLTSDLLAALETHRLAQAEERLAAGPAQWADPGLLFASEAGTVLGEGSLRRMFRVLLARAGVTRRYRPHDLRHTAASHLIAAGVPLSEVAQILGHASPAITLSQYAHLIPRGGKSALQQVEAWAAAGRPAPTEPEAPIPREITREG